MRVLLMGDSIRMGYQPYVKRILESTGGYKALGRLVADCIIRVAADMGRT